MSPRYKIALAEVNYILDGLDEAELKKIPQKLKNFIQSNKTDVNVDLANLKEETYAILAIIYRKFLAPEEERKRLEEEYKQKLHQEQTMVTEKKYTPELTFEKKLIESGEKRTNVALVKQEKTNFFTRIISRIKLFFYGNN